MYNLQINELTPGRKYYVKVRAKSQDLDLSEWSPVFEFTTTQDTVPPHRVGNLTFISAGDSFIAKWDAPIVNADATPCTDLSYYTIRLTDIDGNTTATVRSSINTFNLDYNSNKQLFGQIAGRIKIEVAAVDTVGNTSAYEEMVAQNPAPAKVQNLSAVAGVETVTLAWDLGTETDISHYEIHASTAASFVTGPTTYKGQVSSGSNTYAHTTSSLVTVYFKVIAVDKFNQKSPASDAASSKPKLSTDYDVTPPGAVAGFTVTQVLSPDNLNAVARVSFTPLADTDLDKYEIQYRKTGDTALPWSFETVPSDQATAEIKRLPLSTSYDFKIRAVDFNSNKGAWSSVVVAAGVKKTALPAAPTAVTVRGGMSNLMITWTGSTDVSMSNFGGTYEVQISKATTFTTPTTIKTSSTLASFTNLDQNTVYYARVRSLDPYGNIGGWSTTANGNTGIVADLNASKVIWSDTQPATGKTNDLWIKTPENVQYRYNGTTWVKAQDTELTGAINNAITTADGKNTNYYSTPPATGIKEGDTWFDGPVIKVYKNGTWVDASTALDNAKANQAIQIAGSKNKTYYVSRATATGMIEGDTLFDPTDGNKIYRYDGSSWVAVQDAAIAAAAGAAGTAQTTADKKNTTYYTTPPAGAILKDGDVWFDGAKIKTYRGTTWVDSSTGLTTQQATDATTIATGKNKTYYVAYANRPTTGLSTGDLLFDTADKYKAYRYNGTTWETVRDGTIADAQSAANAAKTAAELRAQTFYEATGPANTNSRLKINDLWIRSSDNQLHRWSGSAWLEIQDDAIALTQSNLNTAVTNLQQSITNVEDYADGKVDSFISDTTPTGMVEGDIWFDTSVTPIAVKVYRGTTWVVSGDKAAIDAAAAVQVNLNATNVALNKKNTTYAQTSEPTTGLVIGDLWLDTTLVGGVAKNEMNRWNGTAWIKTQDKLIFDAQALADGKAMVFTKATMPTDAESDLGDIWFDTSTTPWTVKVRTGATAWTISGDATARTAAQTAQTEAARKIQSFYSDTDPAGVPANNVKTGDIWYTVLTKRAQIRTASNTWQELKDTAIDAVTATANDLKNTVIPALQGQVDNKIEITVGGTRPSFASATAAQRLSAKGDMHINTGTGLVTVYSGVADTWNDVKDPAALSAANSAATLAGTKRQVFGGTTEPSKTANVLVSGDLWLNETTQRFWKYNGTSWIEFKDVAIATAQSAADAAAGQAATALGNAQTAFNLADGKAQVFFGGTRPTNLVAADKGDIWVDTTKTPNEIQTWSGTAWAIAGDPATKTIADAANTLAGQKSYVYTQTTAPTAASTPAPTRGDTWIHSTTGETKIWSGSAWIVTTDPAAQAIANRKITTYYNATTPPTPAYGFSAGDLWVKTPENRMNRWSGSAWIELKDSAITAVETTANNLANTIIPALSTQVDNKVEVYIQTTQPAITDAAKQKGDLWINPTTGLVKIYSGTGTTWNDVKDPAAAQAAIDAATLAGKKVQVFGGNSTPLNNVANALKAHDLWIRDSDKKMHRWTGTAWEVAQDYKIDASALKGNNLVFNGHGELGDNTNWPGTVYTAADAPPGSKGSFVVDGKKTVTLSESISVNPYANYTLSVWARRTNEVLDRTYMFVAPFDAYGLSIQPGNYMYRPGSTTQLTADLKPGDTEIKVVSTANWFVGAGTNYYVTFWDYVDPGGKAWPKETFTRNQIAGSTMYDATVALPPTSIPLKTPWAGALKPAGTWLSSGLSGGSYMYNALASTLLPAEWTFYKSGIIGGIHDDPINSAGSKFPLATASVRIGFLANYSGLAGAQQAYSGLDFSDVNAAQDMATTAQASANARNRSIFSTGNATGTSNNGYAFINGDMWYKKDANNTIIGMWEYLNNAWIVKAINNEVIANLDAGKINAGTINADRIGAGTIGTNKLLIGSPENIVDNGGFEYGTEGWNLPNTGGVEAFTVSAALYGGTKALRVTADGNYKLMTSKSVIEVEPGETYRATVSLTRQGVVPTAGRVRFGVIEQKNMGDMTVGLYTWTLRDLSAVTDVNTWKSFEFEFTVRANRHYIVPMLDITSETTTGTQVFFDDFAIRKMTGSTLIENGAITTDKIKVNAIDATKIVVGGLDAKVVIEEGTISADELAANSVIAGKIATGAITTDKLDANAVTAAKIKAGEIDATKIVSTGMDATLVIQDGTITATEIAGQTITGDKIVGNTIDATHIKAGSITIGATSPIAPGTVAVPSDVTAAISTAAGDATTKANTAKSDAITAAGTAADSKVATALTTAANTAQAKADAAKTAAEAAAKQYADGQISATALATANAAATDAQTKANTAKSEAIAAAGTAADGKISTAVGPINTKIGGWSHPTNTTFIDGGKIFTDSITAGQIAANAITVNELAANAVTADKIKAGEINATKIVSGGMDGSVVIANGTITATQILGKTITGAEIKAGTLDAGHIAAGSITVGAGKPIAAGTVALPSDVTAAEARAATDAQTKANTAKSQALTEAATTAQTKADEAALAAKNAAQSYADGKITTAEANAIAEAAITAQTKADAARDAAIATSGTNADTKISTAVGPINTKLTGWTKTGFTTIDGGKIATDSITAAQIGAGEITASELAADSVVAGKIAVDAVEANNLEANMIVGKNLQIQSALTINAVGGHIKSSNWNDSAKTGFYMDQQQLVVHNGRIEAAAIKLQDSANLMPPQYASFNAKAGAYENLLTDGLSITKIANLGKFGGGTLQVSTWANGYLMLGKSAEMNLPIEGGQEYILSFYISNQSNKVITLIPGLYMSSAVHVYGSSLSIASTQTWTRYSIVVTAPAGMNKAVFRLNLETAPATIRLDGIQIEKKVSQSNEPSSWSPPGFTSIDGESITTGAISSNITDTVGNESQPMWSINTAGNAKFMNAVIVGKLIVGGYGSDQTKNANVSIQSDQYETGMAGWAIKGNGDVEFNNGTFRGILNLTKADLTMKAAVSPIQVYSTPILSTTIDVANIQGTTYSYSRIADGDNYKPDVPRLDRKAKFFIGPTTDRSVNIQVHDKDEADAVYLSDAPNNIILTSVNIGEQTNSASEPADVEDQGVILSTKRVESKNYTYAGISAADKASSVLSKSGPVVKLRSPYYPETSNALDAYPRATHDIITETNYSMPQKKNLLSAGVASGWTFPATIHTHSTAVSLNSEIKVMSGALTGRFATIAASPFQAANQFMIRPFPTVSFTAGKRYILSFYVDTTSASSDYYIGVTKGSQWFIPAEINTDALPTKPNFYVTNPPADYFKLSSNWANTGSSKGFSDLNVFDGAPHVSDLVANIAAGQRAKATATKATQFANGGTVSFWFNPSSSSPNTTGTMYHRASPSSVNKEMWVTFDGNREALQGGIALAGTARTWSSNTVLKRDKWHHIAIVLGPSVTARTFQVYIDGTLEVNTTFASITGSFDTAQPLNIGADRALTQFFEGKIGDIAHWESVLNADQVAAIHATSRSMTPFDTPAPSLMTKIEAGHSATRISFSTDVSVPGEIQMVLATNVPGKINLYSFQLEEAAYKDDITLPQSIRDSKRPTAWSVSDLSVTSRAGITVDSHPVTNFLDYVDSTKFLLPAQRSLEPANPPSEISFDLSSSFDDEFATDSVFSSDLFQAEATYKMSARGLSFPGSTNPFLPTAATLTYDFSDLGATSKPRVGGTGYTSVLLNTSAHGGIRIGSGGQVIKSYFNVANTSEGNIPAPWQIENLDVRVSAERLYVSTDIDGKSEGEGYVYHGQQLPSQNQDVSVMIQDTAGAIYYFGRGGPVVSIDPVRKDRIVFIVSNSGDDRNWKLVSYKSNVKNVIASGALTGTRAKTPRIRLVRTGNTLTGYYDALQVFSTTFNSTLLPQGGRYTGITSARGGLDNFVASLAADNAFTRGVVQPYSVNVNNGRGLQIFPATETISGQTYQPGDIYVLAPGYYQVMVRVISDGAFGNADADWFRISAYLSDDPYGSRSMALSNIGGATGIRSSYITATGTFYAAGKIEFKIDTNDTSVSYINFIEIQIVRLA